MKQQVARWGVVSTVNEPMPLILAFVAHYLDLGASRVHLYFDEPHDEIKQHLVHLPQVITHFTDNEFYNLAADQAEGHLNYRQTTNANHAYGYTDVDWLLHVDADEFLECDDFAARLSALPDTAGSARIINQERAYLADHPIEGIFDGVAIGHHKLAKRWVRDALNRQHGNYLINGLIGHCSGKSVVRTGLRARMGVHSPRAVEGYEMVRMNDVLLHHFDGMTPGHWVAKLLRYARKNMFLKGREKAGAMNRYYQIEFLSDRGATPEVAFDLHDELRVLKARNIELRKRFGLVHPIGIDPGAAIARWMPDQNVDLSADHFDQLLADRDPSFADWLKAGANRHAA